MVPDIYNPKFVMSLFNKMSTSYERMNYITSFGFSIRWRKQFIKDVQLSARNPEVLDLLCGMGETWGAIKSLMPDARLSGLDFSEGMLQKAAERNLKRFKGEVTLLNEDFLQSDLPDNTYDLITCGFGLKTFNEEQLTQMAKQINRILKPGGKACFIEVSVPDGGWLRFLYGFYLGNVIPVLGRLFLGNPWEYRFLWKYTQLFSNCKQAATLFKATGMEINYRRYFMGCASGFVATKIKE